jgi:hypothetical protein
MITVTTENELQEAYRFGNSQNSFTIKAICKPNPQKKNPITFNDSIVVIAPAAKEPIVKVVPTEVVPEPCINPSTPSVIKTQIKSTPCKVTQKSTEVKPVPIIVPLVNSKPTPVFSEKFQSKLRHMAYCDSCKKDIYGIRYKCSSCLDFDLCETCEENNLTQKFHPENHFFLKVNKPVRNSQLNAVMRTISPALLNAQTASTSQLEDRVGAAESRLMSLEQKMKDLALKPKCRKALKKMILEEQGKVKAQPCERRRKLHKTVTPAPVPAEQEQSQSEEPLSEKKEETLATTSCQPIAGSFLEFSLVRAAAALPDPLPNLEMIIEEPCPLPQVQPVPEPIPEVIETEKIAEVEPEPVPVTEESSIDDCAAVRQLVLMGFDRDIVLRVVEVYPDLEEALEHLLYI